MTIDSVSDYDNAMDYAAWALETGLWDGRVITPEGLDDFKEELVANIAAKLFSQDPDSFAFQKMALELAYIGGLESDREEFEEELAALQALQNGIIVPAGFCKSIKKFWKKHKVEILVGIAVVAVVTAVAVGVLCTAAAAGTLAADAAKAKKDPPKPTPPPAKREDPPASPSKNQVMTPTETPLWPQTNLSMDKDGVILNGERLSFNNAFDPQMIAPAIQSFGDVPFWKAYESFLIRDPEAFGARLRETPVFPGNYLPAQKLAPLGNTDNTCGRIRDTYASSIICGSLANRSEIPPPFQDIPLIGNENQGTVHFHCGINNNELTVIEGGSKLWETLDQKFAIHPHLVHSDSLAQGLALVHAEKLHNPQITRESIRPMTAINPDLELVLLPNEMLRDSFLSRSIDYEASMLAKIADNIIETGNPKLKQAHVAFSNGGHVFKEALKRLTPEQQQTVIAITAGTTAIIDEHLACKVYNVIGSKDWPSILCNGGIKGVGKASESANVMVIPQTATEGIVGGHYFLQADYQGKIVYIFKMEIIDKYEIY